MSGSRLRRYLSEALRLLRQRRFSILRDKSRRMADAMAPRVSMSELEAVQDDWSELDRLLLPISAAVSEWPVVELTEVTASYLRQGQPVQVSNAPTDGWVRIFTESSDRGDSFIGVGAILGDGRVAPRRLVAH